MSLENARNQRAESPHAQSRLAPSSERLDRGASSSHEPSSSEGPFNSRVASNISGTSAGSIAEQTAGSAGPDIVLHGAEGNRGPFNPYLLIPRTILRSKPSDESLSSYRESLDLEDLTLTVNNAAEGVKILSHIPYCLHITFNSVPLDLKENTFTLSFNDPNGYPKIEQAAQDLVEKACRPGLSATKLSFDYGNCTIIGEGVEKCGNPLTTREDWEAIRTILMNYWCSKPHQSLRLDIFRDYFAFRSRANSDASFAGTKREEIQALMKRAADGRRYIPRTALLRITSMDTIRKIIVQDTRLEMQPNEKEEFIQKVKSKAPYLLAMCVHAGLKMECLNKLLNDGYSDASLPLTDRHCCHPKCTANFDTIVERQGGFLAAQFNIVGEHQKFDRSTVIPIHYHPRDKRDLNFLKEEEDNDSEIEKISASNDDEAVKRSSFCGSGNFSNVFRVSIEPDHHRLNQNRNAVFAMKVFKDRPKSIGADFNRELRILDELRKFPHKHIVTHLATWIQDGGYCMLFPCAQCNLRQYMKSVIFGASTKENIIWLLRQFLGLAGAVQLIHNLSIDAPSPLAPSLTASHPGERKSGWHHDLKPENILYYRIPGPRRGTFQISDFGSAKVHTYRSGTGSVNTRSINGTLTYEPPESKSESATSRPYDVWSLGCVFLELLIWAILGLQSVEQFAEQRQGRRFPGSPIDDWEDDTYWQRKENGEFILRPSVILWIQKLEKAILQQEQQPFKEVLELVICMLEPQRLRRIKALDVKDTLNRIYIQKKVDLESLGDDSVPRSNSPEQASLGLPRLPLNPPRRSGHRRNSSASELLSPHSREPSIASSSVSTRAHLGTSDEGN